MTATSSLLASQTPDQTKRPPSLILIMIWHALVGVGLLLAATQIWELPAFYTLGNFVQRLVAVVVVGLGLVMLATVPLLYRLKNGARLVGLLFDLFGMVLALLFVGHIVGLYLGIDDLAAGAFRNAPLLLGFPIGYALVWFGGRLDERNSAREWLSKIGLGIMMLTLMAVLVASGLVDSIGTLLQGLTQPQALIALAIAVISGAAGITLARMGERFGETIPQREAWQGWLFLLPNFISFLLFFAMPLVLSFYLSFTDYNAVQTANFIGTANYQELLSLDFQTIDPATQQPAQVLARNHFEIVRINLGDRALIIGARDPLFWQSLATTVRYCIFLLILAILPALGLALLLNSKIPGMRFFRAVYFLPSIAAVVGVALIWQWLYDPVIGYINYTITQIVTWLNTTFGAGVTDPAIKWLTDDQIMLYSVVIMAAWQVIGFNTVILLAGLQAVPRELIEASTVDGAGVWTRFRKIILPLIAPTTFFVTVTTLIAGLQAFSEMFVLFGNSTSNARLTVVFYLYQQGFQRFRMGYASSTAWVLFVLIFAVTLIQFRLSSRSKAYSD